MFFRYNYTFHTPLKYTVPNGYDVTPIYFFDYTPFLNHLSGLPHRFNAGTSYYTYNWISGGYERLIHGKFVPVDFNEVFTNFIEPNSSDITSMVKQTVKLNDQGVDIPFIYTDGFSSNGIGIGVTNFSWASIIRNVDANNNFQGAGEAGGGLDGMDYANSSASLTGTFVGGAQYAVGVVTNQSLWSASYKISKALKSVGFNVQTRAIKHGAKTVLANASRKIAIVGSVLAVADVFMDGQVNASHLLNAGMVGVSAIPVFGWLAGGVYFAADMITIGVSGQSIGQHLDNYVGGPIYDF